jgi:hypothetical protein
MREAIGWYRRALDIVKPVGDVGLARQAYEGLGATLPFTSDILAALNKQGFVHGMRIGDVPRSDALLEESEALASAAGEDPGLAELNWHEPGYHVQHCGAQAPK